MRIKIAINFQIWHMSATTLNTARPEWFPGQVTVDSRSDFDVLSSDFVADDNDAPIDGCF